MCKFYFNVFIILLLFSCNYNSAKISNSEDKFSLILKSNLKLDLDSLTGFYSPYLDYKKKADTQTLSLLNPLINRIQSYDISTGEQINNINYDLVGPHSVGENPSGFFILNKDSIIIYDNWQGNLSLINSKKEIINKFNVNPNGLNNGFAFPQASTVSPIIVHGQKIYMAGLLLPWKGIEINEKQFLVFDMSKNKLEYKLKRPNLYNESNWGNRLMFFMSYTFDKKNERFIFSFNNDKNLIITSLDFKILDRFETPSLYFDEIEPYDEDFNYDWNEATLEEYNYQTPRYWKVLYDEYRDLIYRFALHPYPKSEFKAGVRRMKVSILIIKNKNVVGEFDLDLNKYDSRMIFVSEEGLNIANKSKFEKNEDYLTFDTFVVDKIKSK